MNSERFKKVEEIYQAVLEVASEKRDLFLSKTCGADRELREEVESLLAFEKSPDSILDTPPDTLAAGILYEKEETDYTGEEIGHYQIISPIGSGGMGTVYLAKDSNLDRYAAVKFLDGRYSRYRDHLQRFIFEAKSASALNHPNIITIYEVGESAGIHFIAAEFIEGETLRQKLRNKNLKIGFILETAVQIASALDAAHSTGIIHRDIKPDNIMIRPDGLVKILDFGIAKLTVEQPGKQEIDEDSQTLYTTPNTEPGTLIGTPDYMSPEQVRGKNVTSQTDIFSFGLVLYEMLTGKLPFAGETPGDAIAALLTKKPEPLDEFEREIPGELQQIVEKALRKDTNNRYRHAGEMLEDLQRLKKNREIKRETGRSLPPANSAEAETKILKAGSAATAHQTFSGRATQNDSGSGIKVKTVLALALSVLLIAVVGYGFWYYSGTGTGQIESIAVMPFTDKSGNAENEYLSDGLTESLISNLSQLSQITVKARSSVFRYKGKEIEPQKIGRELSVQAILLGQIVQHEERLTFSLELVDTRSGNLIWGEQYSRHSSDLVSLQNEIAQDVLDKLRKRLSNSDEQKIAKKPTDSNEAYRHYLKGRYFWNKRTAANFKKAIEEFRAAVDKDPNFALAYAGLADSYVLMENFAGTPSSETLPLAKAFAQRALAIDDSLPEAQASLAISHHRSWEWTEAERAYRRVFELNPNYASAHHWYSLLLRETGRFDESLAAAQRAQELDPLSGIIIGNLGLSYIAVDDADSAVELMKRMIELDPDFPWGYSILGLAYIKKGNFDEALAETRKGADLITESSNALSIFGYAAAAAGKREEALAVIKKLEEKYDRKKALGRNIARVYAGLGEKDKAFAWLEKDFQTRSSFLPYISWFPAFEPLRDDPRYKDLLKRMDLPER